MRTFIAVVLTMAVVSGVAYGQTDVLENGGFEDGTVSEPAFDWSVWAAGKWLGPDCGSGAVAATTNNPRTGTYSLEMNPIGWGSGEDGACGTGDDENSKFFLINMAIPADSVTFTGYVNVENLDSAYSIVGSLMTLTENLETVYAAMAFDPVVGGGVGWQEITATVSIEGAEGEVVFVFLEVPDSLASGVPGSFVYFDDFALVYNDVPDKSR